MKDNETGMDNKHKRLIKDTIIFAIGNIGSKIILFFLVPLYTNVLSTEEYGIADLVFTVSQFLIPFVSLVIFDAVIRFGLSKKEKPKDVLVTSFIVLGMGALATVILTPIFRLYAPLSPWRWYLCVYVILTMISNVELNYLKVLERNKTYALISIAHTAVMAVANIIFLTVTKLGVRGYLLATIAGSFTTTLLAFFAASIPKALNAGRYDKNLANRMIAFSAPLILNNISWWVIQSSDKIMIEAMASAASLGLYTVATKIPSLINVIISIFSQAWGISSVREIESDNDDRFYAEVFNVYSTVAFGASVIIILIVKPFMRIYVGSDFTTAWRYVPLLLASASFSAIASYFGSLYGALKLSVRNMTSTFAAAIVNILVNYICIKQFGVWGALIGTVTAYVVLAFFRMIDVLYRLKFDLKWPQFLISAGIVLAQAIAVSFDFHIYTISITALVAFIIVNLETIKGIAKTGLKLLRRR